MGGKHALSCLGTARFEFFASLFLEPVTRLELVRQPNQRPLLQVSGSRDGCSLHHVCEAQGAVQDKPP